MPGRFSDLFEFSWKKELKEIFLIALIGIPFGLFMCRDCWENTKAIAYSISISSVMWVVLWKGNSITSCLVDIYFDWLKQPITRLIVGVLSHTAFTMIAVYVLYIALKYFLNISIGNVFNTMGTAVGVTMIVALIAYSRSFLLSWREVAVESEKMKKEAVTARYETLKNQVNPHFLFNSFNTLTNLVYENPDTAASFIKKLSDVYRYVLEMRDKELVGLDDEMQFVNSYIYLQQLRHEDGLNIEVNLNGKSGFVVPLSIQMLVENAIKHNIISEDEPLSIKIYSDEESLIIENNLQKKNIMREDSSEIGLANIKSRYDFLSDTPVKVEESDRLFKVTLPIIKGSEI